MKIALIGGGSVRTIYFIRSLAKFAEDLGIDRIDIMDNDPRKLDIFATLAQYAVKDKCTNLEIKKTKSLRYAVSGADYVVTTIRVGQDLARCMDERIALSLGVIGQETTGAGGFSYAMRSVPAMLECCRAVKEESNNATVFNFTNPSGLVTQAMHDAGFTNVIGICDNATGIKMDLAKSLKMDASEIFVRIYGLNHLSWVDRVCVDGENILDKLIENEHFLNNFHQFEYFDRDLIKQLERIPNGYLYYFYHREKALSNMLKSPLTRGETILKINEEMIGKIEKADPAENPGKAMRIFDKFMKKRETSYMKMEQGGNARDIQDIDTELLGINIGRKKKETPRIYEGYAGVAFNYIESVRTGNEIDLALNVKNDGAIEGFEDEDIVEITCTVGKNGAKPLNIGKVPQDSFLLMKQVKYYEKLAVEAIFEKSKSIAIKALMENPLVASYSLAKALTQEYCVHNEQYTGRWR